jgi:hypothetical protein
MVIIKSDPYCCEMYDYLSSITVMETPTYHTVHLLPLTAHPATTLLHSSSLLWFVVACGFCWYRSVSWLQHEVGTWQEKQTGTE